MMVHHSQKLRASGSKKRPDSGLASKILIDVPRVNLVSILAGALVLISIFLRRWEQMELLSASQDLSPVGVCGAAL
jgi:hypothetical protein